MEERGGKTPTFMTKFTPLQSVIKYKQNLIKERRIKDGSTH